MAASHELVDNQDEDANGEKAQEILFNPPLYIQRYDAVCKLVTKYHDRGMKAEQLLDVGCAECKFLKRAVKLPFLKTAYGLDIDKELLQQKAGTLEPLITDHVRKRRFDLDVKVFAGSIVDQDPRILGTDVVTAIEVIEHLHEPILDGFVETVFSYIHPKLIIITTPNSEFNVLFSNFSGLRHWDHKFEWTRDQFREWCSQVSKKHGYRVEYDGVGDPPVESSSLGPCSQIAVFKLADEAVAAGISSSSDKYEQIYSAVYPGINMTDSQLLDMDIEYHLNSLSFNYIQENIIDDLSQTPIPLSFLLKSSSSLKEQLNITDLCERLDKLGYILTADRQSVILDMEKSSSSVSSDEEYVCPEQMDSSRCLEDVTEELWD
ncbi:small RNA 2'-O-methyltransferase-like [Watersipora subatra]|uniref:small RNA 2'-O-methyltransferase-like n=1 Tax=Watersipora subatra TaxID=2589382 RepID=UPI00355B74C8